MTLQSSQYQDPAVIVEKREFFSLGCGACAFHKPKPDRSEFHCIAGCEQWPDGSNKSCGFFAKRKKERVT
jgi:hypothetical protein